jgi:hypothetical protein
MIICRCPHVSARLAVFLAVSDRIDRGLLTASFDSFARTPSVAESFAAHHPFNNVNRHRSQADAVGMHRRYSLP